MVNRKFGHKEEVIRDWRKLHQGIYNPYLSLANVLTKTVQRNLVEVIEWKGEMEEC
jgi:hypothetical protein